MRNRLVVPCLAVLPLLALGCMSHHGGHHGHHGKRGHGGFNSDASSVQVVSTLIGGKNVFIPSTIVVTGGTEQTLSLYNTTDTPHGFRIDALGIEAILPVQEEFLLKLPALEGGNVYAIRCHLHPPHRHATLVVLRGKGECRKCGAGRDQSNQSSN